MGDTLVSLYNYMPYMYQGEASLILSSVGLRRPCSCGRGGRGEGQVGKRSGFNPLPVEKTSSPTRATHAGVAPAPRVGSDAKRDREPGFMSFAAKQSIAARLCRWVGH